MDNYWDNRLNEKEASVLNRETEILQQLQDLQKEYNELQTQKTNIKSVREGKSPVSDLIGYDSGQGVYSGLVQGESYPVKLGEQGQRGTAKWSGDNNIYYTDNNGQVVQSGPMTIVDPTGSQKRREVFNNMETFATDVKRGANALVKGNAYSNLGGLWNWNKRGIGNNLLNNRSSSNSSMKRLGGNLF